MNKRDSVVSSFSSRRSFLRSTAAVAAALHVPSAVYGQGHFVGDIAGPDAKSTGEHRGRIYKTFKFGMFNEKNLPLVEKFKVLKDCGFEGVEMQSPAALNVKEINEAIEATGFVVPGLVQGTHWRVRMSDPDPKVRDQAVADTLQALRDAHAVGASTVLIVVGKVDEAGKETHDDVWKRSIECIRRCLPTAAKLGVRLGCENVWNGFCYDPKQWAQYIDEIGSPWVGAYFDIGNHVKYGKPADWIRTLGTRIIKLDVKDWSFEHEKNNKGRGFCKIGEGDADWPAVRKALAEIGYTGWASAEVAGGDRKVMSEISHRMDVALGL